MREVLAKDAHLHLWTTVAFLFDAKPILEAWGFEYRSNLTWTKPNLGIGNYWRLSHEHLLFGLHGHQPFLDRGVASWFTAKREKHSAKPELVRGLIERVSPGPYLELFGRRAVPNWTVLGDQVDDHVKAEDPVA